MDKIFDNLINLRKTLLQLTEDLSVEQLNKIPQGFNNNIIWNMGHVIAAQQGICYTRSNLSPTVDINLVGRYKPGTLPVGSISEEEINKIKSLLLPTIENLTADYQQGVFKEYIAVTTRYGVELTNIDNAIDFLQFHEGFHMGYVLALKRSI
ncbi:MAG TPA: DinB family protein [Mucilaginibacter sp.]|nr:DinB family protein [Mucilaginibacter sp.]